MERQFWSQLNPANTPEPYPSVAELLEGYEDGRSTDLPSNGRILRFYKETEIETLRAVFPTQDLLVRYPYAHGATHLGQLSAERNEFSRLNVRGFFGRRIEDLAPIFESSSKNVGSIMGKVRLGCIETSLSSHPTDQVQLLFPNSRRKS